MNDADRWQQIKALFLEALDCPPDERAAFLDNACAGDAALQAEVMDLLQADAEEDDSLLDKPVLETPLVPDPDLESQVGAYRLVRLLGRGGMGNVYLAERTDGTFQHHVALKLIRRGLDTDDILSRFRYERQILASLDHPNIAHLLDGGMTNDGRPYFVLEYVEGVPITDYCDAHRLPMRQRLALFRTVCRAVQYAHQNLVVHRDLKPSNILVTEEGQVKLLDFGIAKLLSDDGASQTIPLTQTGQRLMTPEYASPEQVRGEAITTATDVYQLGVLLYELLTGQRPYHLDQRVRATIEQAILEEEPTRPSTAVQEATTTRPVDVETISTARATRPADLSRALRGDLDTICLTALHKSQDRRYASVEQFSEDIRRHLVGLPVTARADSVPYRLGKFIQRHRAGVLTSALVLMLLLGGSVLYTVRIRAERDRTAQALRQSEEAFAFLQRMIWAGDPIEGNPDTPIGVVLDSAAARVDVDLQEPAVARTVHAALGYVYLSLDRIEQAEHHLQRALALQGDQADISHVVNTLNNLALVRTSQGRYDEAETEYQKALDLIRTEHDANLDLDRATTLDNYGTLLSNIGREEEAVTHFEETLRIYRAQNHPDTALTLNNLAIAHYYLGALDLATSAQQRSIAGYRAQQAPPVRIGIALGVLAGMYRNQPDSALANYQRAAELLTEALGATHIETITTRISLALQHHRNGNAAVARTQGQAVLHDALEALGADHAITAYAQDVVGAILCEGDEPLEGAALVRQGIATRSTFLPEDHWMLASSTSLLGGCLLRAGQTAEAEPLLVESYAQLLEAQGEEAPTTQRARKRLHDFYLTTGRTEEAEQLGGSSY